MKKTFLFGVAYAFLCDVACGIELLSTHKNLLRTRPTHRSKDASALRGGSGSRVQLTEPFGVGVWRGLLSFHQPPVFSSKNNHFRIAAVIIQLLMGNGQLNAKFDSSSPAVLIACVARTPALKIH